MTKLNPLPGIPPQMSVLAAMSAGLVPANAQVTGLGTGGPNNTVLADLSSGDTPGAGQSASDLFGNSPASSLTFDSPVKYGGD